MGGGRVAPKNNKQKDPSRDKSENSETNFELYFMRDLYLFS